MSATAPQQPDLMALANAVLERNNRRNTLAKTLTPQCLPCCAQNAPRARNTQQIGATALSGETAERNKKRTAGATGAAQFAAESYENASEYMAEREAICAVDGLPPAMLRPVFTCVLRGNPPFTLLGRVGDSLAETAVDLRRQFGDDFVSLEPYRPKPASPNGAGATISARPLPEHGSKAP